MPSAPSFTHFTATIFDELGRPSQVTTPDGQSAANSYFGSRRTVTDQAGASRTMEEDALGRVRRVQEPDPFTGAMAVDEGETFYFYNALDNLTLAAQGVQRREFEYDLIGRLTSERQPESGTESFF